MKVRSHMLSPSGARGVAILCVAVFVSGADAAHAGINVWTSHGPGAEAISSLAIDPSTPTTLYAPTHKSTDGATSWQATDASLPSGTVVQALAIDPTNPTTLYAQTYPGGVFKSTDGATSWQVANTGLPDATYVGALAIDPSTPRTLYAGTYTCAPGTDCTSFGVYKSTDGGESWQAGGTGLNGIFIDRLAVDPSATSTLYAGTYTCAPGDTFCARSGTGVFKSTDSGGTWGPLNTGLPIAPNVDALAIDPITPSTLYAGTYTCYPCIGTGVFKSTDSGGTWMNTGLPVARYFGALAIDPITTETLYAASGGVFKSTDSGGTWGPLNTGLPIAPNVDVLAIDPITPSTLYAGTDGGDVFSIEQVAVCLGNCEGTHTVAVSDIITLVNIALDTAPPAACSNGGLPLGGDVNVAIIIQAVNNALNGCMVQPTPTITPTRPLTHTPTSTVTGTPPTSTPTLPPPTPTNTETPARLARKDTRP